MVGSALFLQPACMVHTVHCTNMMHSRKPSLWSPSPFLVNPVNRYFYIRGNEIRHVFLKHFHLIAHDINTVKHLWFSPCTSRNIVMFESLYVDFKTISVPFTHVLYADIVISWSWLGFWRHCWLRQWVRWVIPIGSEIYAWNARFDFTYCLTHFINHFIFHVIKGIKNVCPCIVEIRGTQGCALATICFFDHFLFFLSRHHGRGEESTANFFRFVPLV